MNDIFDPVVIEQEVNLTSDKLLEASKNDVDLRFAMTQHITESSVAVSNYRIDIVIIEFAGQAKRFYNIVDISTNNILHDGLALFETAMAIVKKYMTDTGGKVIEELVKFDTEYTSALHEVWSHNSRARRGKNENIALAKASAAKTKVIEAKRKILKRL
tara:strand:- start:28 stop:504 length:477 start_codon:yes stop_codon:yes gene_type:complete